jgi:ribosomal protein S18 acetylase RimI-like enzyme
VIELDIDDARGAEAFRAQHAAFGVTDPAVVARLHELDRRLRLGADKRFFALPDPPGVARGPGGIAAFAALVPGTEVAYVDTVVTFPHARRRGLASRLVAHLLAVASPGSPQAYLLVDADGPVRLYERLGFRVVTRIVSALEPA